MGRKKKYKNGAVLVTISTDPETVAELDRRRGKLPRGDYLKWLLEVTRGLDPSTEDSKRSNQG